MDREINLLKILFFDNLFSSGLGQFCALEMLSAAGLINYFGRTTDLKDIKISPLLLEKGRTKLAIYGLSSIKDERLFRLFRESKVRLWEMHAFYKPISLFLFNLWTEPYEFLR